MPPLLLLISLSSLGRLVDRWNVSAHAAPRHSSRRKFQRSSPSEPVIQPLNQAYFESILMSISPKWQRQENGQRHFERFKNIFFPIMWTWIPTGVFWVCRLCGETVDDTHPCWINLQGEFKNLLSSCKDIFFALNVSLPIGTIKRPNRLDNIGLFFTFLHS